MASFLNFTEKVYFNFERCGLDTKVLLPFAIRGESLVHISEVSSGRKCGCVCPACNEGLIARKGAKISHHFAHDAGSKCSIETALHSLTKRLIHDGIQRALSAGASIGLSWRCDECQGEHKGNLLKRGKTVRLEHSLGEVRPDILLLDSSERPLVAIEVVVTHPPEPEARDFYERENITLVLVKVGDAASLESLRDLKALPAYEVTLCLRKKCPDCKTPLIERSLVIVASDCYRCGRPMKVVFLECEGMIMKSDDFTASDIASAKAHGCLLENRFSRTAQRQYLANICPSCSAFVGEHYIGNHDETARITSVRSGFHCFDCDKSFSSK
jgi:hypothetical protein